MPIYMQYDGIKSVTMKPYADAAALVTEVRKTHPLGVDQILIGQASRPSFVIAKNRQGIIAILIGMLLPAVQKIDVANSADGQVLCRALKSTGALGFALCDGSVRQTFGSMQSFGRFQIREWSYLSGGTWVSGDPITWF